MEPEITKMAQQIAPELNRLTDEFLATLTYENAKALELCLWHNKIGILRIVQAAAASS